MKVVAVFIMAVFLVFPKGPSQAAEKKVEIRVIAADSLATKEAEVFCRRFSRLFSEYASAMKNVDELAKEWQISCLEYVDTSGPPQMVITLISRTKGDIPTWRVPRDAHINSPFSAAKLAAEKTIKALLEQSKERRR